MKRPKCSELGRITPAERDRVCTCLDGASIHQKLCLSIIIQFELLNGGKNHDELLCKKSFRSVCISDVDIK